MVRGRPKKLKDNLKKEIVKIQFSYPKWTLKEIQGELKQILTNSIKADSPTWNNASINEAVTEKLPGISAIQKFLKLANKELSPLDNPWHMGTLKDYPLPSEAIPSILAALESREMFTRHREVTIRQALWISRLHTEVKHKDDLRKIAWHYAFNERISEVSHTDFNTSEYDRRLPNPKELLEYFENRIPQSDYLTHKKTFGQVTLGVEYEPGLLVDHLVIRDNKVYAPLLIREKPTHLEMQYSAEALLEAVKREKSVKSVKKLKNGVTVIRFKETISLGFENKEFNEYLHNLIKEGEK